MDFRKIILDPIKFFHRSDLKALLQDFYTDLFQGGYSFTKQYMSDLQTFVNVPDPYFADIQTLITMNIQKYNKFLQVQKEKKEMQIIKDQNERLQREQKRLERMKLMEDVQISNKKDVPQPVIITEDPIKEGSQEINAEADNSSSKLDPDLPKEGPVLVNPENSNFVSFTKLGLKKKKW